MSHIAIWGRPAWGRFVWGVGANAEGGGSSPEVISVCPEDATTIYDVTTTIHATFDADMESASITTSSFTLTRGAATSVAGTVAYSVPLRRATFTPDAVLDLDSIYTARLTTAIEDEDGNNLAAEYVWRFRLRTAVLFADREPFQFIEIVQPLCALTYGTAPCTAAIPTTGDRKCYNTRKTCQDAVNYTPTDSITWRFCKPLQLIPHRIFETGVGRTVKTNPIPSLVSVSTSPTTLNVGGGSDDESPMGRRASVTISLRDHPWDDSVGDPYLADRDFTPFLRGSFWSKWIARNPYYSNSIVRVYDGYVHETVADMTVREYLIDSISGPDSSGNLRITAKDVLRLADDKRAQFPPVTEIELMQDIDDSQTDGIQVSGTTGDVLGLMGNAADLYIRVDNEVILYTTADDIADNLYELVGVQRAALNTTAATHREGQSMQRVGRHESLECWKIARDLLLEWTGIPGAYIDSTAWDLEGDTYLSGAFLTGNVAEPTPVIDLLGEISAQSSFYIWWNEREKLIQIKAIRPLNVVPEICDETDIIADSMEIREEPKQRISRVFVYYKQRDPTKRQDDISNYDAVRGRIDLDAEDADQYGESRTKKVFSRWHTVQIQVAHLAILLLKRLRDNPRYLTISLDAKDRAYWTADILDVIHRNLVDDTGSTAATRWQVISAEEKRHGEEVEYVLQRFDFTGKYGIWMADDAPVYDDATDDEKLAGAWWSDADGKMGDGSDGYRWQ